MTRTSRFRAKRGNGVRMLMMSMTDSKESIHEKPDLFVVSCCLYEGEGGGDEERCRLGCS
jgi:hypothetical protein